MDLYQEALKRFLYIYRKVGKKHLNEPTAFTLATSDRRGRPSSRVVLLKDFDGRGFVFYTNYDSRKGRELLQNPWAALTFYWDSVDEQIRVEGKAEAVSSREADAYWSSRPRESQIGACASLQSQELDQRSTFLKRVAQVAKKYQGMPVPRLKNWSGFRVIPFRIEFWERKPFRLHERVLYEKSGRLWKKKLLYP